MNLRKRALTVVAVILLATLACGLPGVETPALPGPESNAQVTAVIETALAQAAQTLTQAAVESSLAPPPPSDTTAPEATATPSLTPLPSQTPLPSETPTPIVPMISVSVATNCRVGPGKVYDYRGALLPGETTEVVARNSTGDYWYVRNPDQPGEFCWLWGNYATIVGNTSVLPIFTPPPTPTPVPDFDLSYEYMEGCVGFDPGFKVTNTGGVTFKSAQVYVKDKVTSSTITDSIDLFDKRNGCIIANAIPTLTPGNSGWVYGNSFGYNPAGHQMTATIKLCTNTGLGGLCVSKSLDFKP